MQTQEGKLRLAVWDRISLALFGIIGLVLFLFVFCPIWYGIFLPIVAIIDATATVGRRIYRAS